MLKRNLIKMVHNYRYDRIRRKSLKLWNKSHLKVLFKACNQAGIILSPQPGEQEFLTKWRQLTPDVSIEFYRFYSHFLGNDPRILPDDIYHAIIDPIINDRTSIPVYSNKNMYEKLFSPSVLPLCIFRNINGDYMDKDYKDIQMDEAMLNKILLKNERISRQGRFIIKPTVETGQGKGVRLFCLKDGKWLSNDGEEMNIQFLQKYYSSDFIVQECVEPSDFFKQFNPVSYSTCRIFTYRSVKDGSMHFMGGCLRIGDVGSFRDNVSTGGYAISIYEDGRLAKFATNGTRNKFKEVNGINLENNNLFIPNFDKILDLALSSASNNMMNRVLSWDIILDKNNIPHIVEFNLKAQTVITIQMYKTFFGEYTDEIIEYCKRKLDSGFYPTQANYRKRI